MQIGLYFGSFNPIHHGHLLIANYVLEHTDLDRYGSLSLPRTRLKPASTLLNEYHRLFLVQTAVEGENKLRASILNSNYQTVLYGRYTRLLQEKYPSYEFSIIMGQ